MKTNLKIIKKMEINAKILLLVYFGIFSLIIFVIQCIHISKGQFSSKDLKDHIENWKLNPIIEISDSPSLDGYSENDYSEYNGNIIYFKRMKHYNYAKIKIQEKNLINPQICGTDNSGKDIYFPSYETCPINYLAEVDSCNSSIENCIEVKEGKKYITYSNNYTNNTLFVKLNDTNITGYHSLEKNSFVPSNFENIFEIPKKLKIKNLISMIFASIMFLTSSFMVIILIIYKFCGCDIYSNCFLQIFPIVILVFIVEGLFICYILGAIWIKEGTNILNSVGLTSYLMNKTIFIGELINLFSCLIMIILYLMVTKFLNPIFDKFEQVVDYIFVKLNIVLIIIGIPILPLIFLGINISKKPFYNGFIEDLKLNYQMSPITQIDISEINTTTNNLDSSYFNSKVPYNLGKIIQSIDHYEKEEIINTWKGKYFYVTRMNSYLTYPKIFSLYNKNETKVCGKDSNGNDLYFPLNEYCPINYIEFTSSPKPSLEGNNYNWTSKKIDSETYMHYTNNKTDGKILVHLRVSTLKPMADSNSYNEICYTLYKRNNCKNDNNYHGYENDIYGYEKLDSSNSTFIDISTNEPIYLYQRTYSGLNEYKTKNDIGEEIFGIKNLILCTHIFSIICYIISLFCILLIIYFMRKQDIEKYTSYFQISFIGFLTSLIAFILEIIVLIRFKKIKNNIFDNSNYDAKSDFIEYPLFYKLDIGVFVYITIILIINLVFSIIFFYQRKSMFTHKVQNDIKEFLTGRDYLVLIIFALFILLLLIIIFPTLLFFFGLYEEGYVETLKENWEKVPITEIEINGILKEKGEILGTFNNFPGEKSIDIYKWRNVTFSFTRKIGNYYYTKILNNKELAGSKICGKDNAGNDIYFRESEDCPINYVSINTIAPSLPGISKSDIKKIPIDDTYYLFYTNKYIQGKILIGFKVSNIKGPCLNKKKNNEICSFYLEKCKLKEKNYVCDAYKTDNGFEPIDFQKYDESFVDYSNSNLTSSNYYDSENTIYLYSETYIGFNNSNRKNEKVSNKIYGIQKFPKRKNIFLFICMFIYIIGGVLFYLFKKKKDEIYIQEKKEENKEENKDTTGTNENINVEGNRSLKKEDNKSDMNKDENKKIYEKRENYITIISVICMFICLCAFACFILSSISIGKHNQIKFNVLQKFNNELTDYYNKIKWQEIIEILNLIIYLIGFIIFGYLSYENLKHSNYKIFKLLKPKFPYLSSLIKINLRREETKYLIINFSFLLILLLFFSLVLLIIKDFNDGYTKDIKSNWSLSPIYSIEPSNDNGYILDTFSGISDSTFGLTRKEEIKKFHGYSFKVERKDSKYNYPYFFSNKKQNSKKCGIDNEGNGIYFPSEETCPINFIEITNSSDCSKFDNCKSLLLNDSLYIHYSNENINGQILVDFKISTRTNSPCGDGNFDNDICSKITEKCNNIKHKKCHDKLNSYGYEKLDETTLYELFSNNSIQIGDAVYKKNTPIYLYYRTYKGIVRKEVDNISKTNRYINKFYNISIFSMVKNISFYILHIVIIIFLNRIFYYFEENEEKYSKKLYLFSLIVILLNIINIIFCSITIDYKLNFQNHIFKMLNSDIDDKYTNIQVFIVLNCLILIFNILLLISVSFWTYDYYIKRDLYVKREWQILIYLKQQKYILFLFLMFFSFIILILDFVLVIKKEYNNGYFKGLEQNWKKSPITSIKVFRSSDNKNYYQFSKFPGTKNKGYGNEDSKEIIFWDSYTFVLERKDNSNYKNVLKGKVKCGTDSYGNNLYFESLDECPINGIEITPNPNPSRFKKKTTLQLDDKYIHYTNENYEGKILVDFKISDDTPSFSLNLDNNICRYIDGMCNLNKKDFYNKVIGNDSKIFDKIDSIQISKLFKDNNIDINNNSFNSSKNITLYAQTYIGLPDIQISIKNVLTVYRFSKEKNIVLIIFSLLFIGSCFSIFNCFKKNFGLYGFIAFVVVNILLFINWVLSMVSVSKYNQITNDVFHKLNNSISEEFKNKKWNYKINWVLIVFYFFDLCLGVLNYVILREENILNPQSVSISSETIPRGGNESTNVESQLTEDLKALDNWFEDLGFEKEYTMKKAEELVENEKKNAKRIEDELMKLKQKNNSYLKKIKKEEQKIKEYKSKKDENEVKNEQELKTLNKDIRELRDKIDILEGELEQLKNEISEKNEDYQKEKELKESLHSEYMKVIQQYKTKKKN